MPTATYSLAIDWANNSSFADSGDDVTTRVRASPGIRTFRGRDQIRELTQPVAGRLDAQLDNQSKDYSAEYGSSPLAGNLLSGRPIRLQATYSSTTYTLWQGFLDDLPQYPHRTELAVGIPSLGPISRLAGKKVSTALYANITTNVAIGHILDAVGWPAGDRTLDTGKTTLAWWWLNEEDALLAIQTLLNTEGPGATFYESGAGKVVFESRHYRILTTRANTSQATFSDGGTEPLYSQPFRYEQGVKDIINKATMTVKTRSADATAVIWTLGSDVTLGANETKTYVASYADPFQSALFVANTDYTVSAGSLTTASLNRTSGQNVTITLTSGASGATVTGVQVRADPVTVDNTPLVTNRVNTATSQTRYGLQTYDALIRNEIAVGTAQDLVDAIASRYKDPRPIVVLTVNNGADARMTQILSREISDLITVVNDQTGLSANFHVESIAHDIAQAGKLHQATLGCEKATGVTYFTIGGGIIGSGVIGF